MFARVHVALKDFPFRKQFLVSSLPRDAEVAVPWRAQEGLKSCSYLMGFSGVFMYVVTCTPRNTYVHVNTYYVRVYIHTTDSNTWSREIGCAV